MNIRLGIYEIFSRIIPGGFYIIAILQLLTIFDLITFDWKTINEISISVWLIFVVIAYIVGGVLDMFSLSWFRLFEKEGFSARQFQKFVQRRKDKWIIRFDEKDWELMLAIIRAKNLDLASEIERQNALSIMLRNVSLGLLLMVVNNIIELIISRNLYFIALGILLLIASLLVIRESVKLRRWFYRSVYNTIIALRLDLEKMVVPVEGKEINDDKDKP